MTGHPRPRCGLCFRTVPWCELVESRCAACRERDQLREQVRELLADLPTVLQLDPEHPARQEWVTAKLALLARVRRQLGDATDLEDLA